MSKVLIGAVITLIGIVINFVLLYIMFFQMRSNVDELGRQVIELNEMSLKREISPISTQSSTASSSADFCTGCREDIEKIKEVLVKLTPAGASFTNVPRKNESSIKEAFIPLGNGKTQSNDWQDIPGMSATIDTLNYSTIKSVYFEISLRIPTANGIVSARLYNKTANHPVWNSEVSSEGPTSTLKQSSNIVLDTGSNLYQVQMKSSLKYESIADSARLKIILQ